MIPSGSSEIRFLHVAQSSGLNLFTGLALLNPSQDVSSTVEVRAVDIDGRVTAKRTLTIEPGVRKIGLLSDEGFFGATFEQVGGHLELTASSEILAFALFGDGNSQYLAAIEGQTDESE